MLNVQLHYFAFPGVDVIVKPHKDLHLHFKVALIFVEHIPFKLPLMSRWDDCFSLADQGRGVGLSDASFRESSSTRPMFSVPLESA